LYGADAVCGQSLLQCQAKHYQPQCTQCHSLALRQGQSYAEEEEKEGKPDVGMFSPKSMH